MKRFVVMGVPRTGSCWFMRTLIEAGALPERRRVGLNYEFLAPGHFAGFAGRVAEYAGRRFDAVTDVVRAFYREDVARRFGMREFAGFKLFPAHMVQAAASMGWEPETMEDLDALLADLDLTVIALWRRDIASQVASELLCIHAPPWTESALDKGVTLELNDTVRQAVETVAQDFAAQTAYAMRVKHVSIVYEEVCRPGFASPELDAFFGRPVRFAGARPPTDASLYVRNWDAFRDCVRDAAAAIAPYYGRS